MLYYNKIEIPVHTAHNILHTQIYIETKRLNKITITFQQEYGIVKNAIKLTDKEWVQVQQFVPCRDDDNNIIKGSFDCHIFELKEDTAFVPSTNIISKVSLMHDCKNGQCSFDTEGRQSKVEREIITRREYSFIHTDYKFYLLNRFYLSSDMINV